MTDISEFDSPMLAIYMRNQLKLNQLGHDNRETLRALAEYIELRIKTVLVDTIEDAQWNRVLKLGVQQYKENL